MLHQIQPHTLRNEYRPRPPRPEDFALCYREREALCPGGRLPTFAELSLSEGQFLFEIDGRGYFWSEPPEKAEGWVPQQTFRQSPSPSEALAGALGAQLWRFYRRHRFCGACGMATRPADAERAVVCPACGLTVYPPLSPAVIVAITHGPRLLMARKGTGDYTRWALVAGYVEAGEGIEETVVREVREEVGLKIRDLRYVASQPWPFSDALMLGFFARLDGDDETITLQDGELAEARWFGREDVPAPTSNLSLGSMLIQAFLDGRE